VALLADSGELGEGQVLRHESVVGSVFLARVVDHGVVEGRAVVEPEVTGTAYRTGTSEFTVDAHDPMTPGFVLR
jgi:proline racemase